MHPASSAKSRSARRQHSVGQRSAQRLRSPMSTVTHILRRCAPRACSHTSCPAGRQGGMAHPWRRPLLSRAQSRRSRRPARETCSCRPRRSSSSRHQAPPCESPLTALRARQCSLTAPRQSSCHASRCAQEHPHGSRPRSACATLPTCSVSQLSWGSWL